MGRSLKDLPEHPHIPKFFGLVGRSKSNSKAWVREYIDGISLQQHLKKGSVTIQKALQIENWRCRRKTSAKRCWVGLSQLCRV